MTSKNNILSLVKAFFACEPPFEHLSNIPPQDSSSIPGEFATWLADRHHEEQRRIVWILLNEVLSEGWELCPHPGNVEQTLIRVIFRSPGLLNDQMTKAVLREAYNEEFLSAWVKDDSAYESGIYVKKKDWRYALVLWSILDSAKRNEGEELYRYYVERLPDSPLERALHLAKHAFDEWV